MNRQWKGFRIPEVFEDFKRGKRLKKADHTPGSIPYVSSTAFNNGVDDFIEPTPTCRKYRNCISLANSGSVGTAFYEPFEFIASDHITHLKRKGTSPEEYLFMATSLEQQKGLFNFNREINDSRLQAMSFMLPVDDNGDIDFDYMNSVITETRQQKLDTYIQYCLEQLSIMGEPVPICELDDKQWKGFFISDLAVLEDKKQPQVPTGASIPQSELMTGSTPRISATSNNNGILSFCHTEHKNKREHENFISVSFLGNAFYHPYKATLDMKIHALRLKDHELNKYIALFIVVCLDNNTKSTSYGDQLSSTDLPRKKILLPVNDNDLPDYEYMEQYIKNVMIAKYRKYLDYVGYSADED